MDLLMKLTKLYDSYCKAEFGESVEKHKWGIEGHIDLLYTTIDNEQWEVQVAYILTKSSMQVELRNEECAYIYQEHEDLEDFVKEMETADFAGFYSYAHDIVESKFHLDLEW